MAKTSTRPVNHNSDTARGRPKLHNNFKHSRLPRLRSIATPRNRNYTHSALRNSFNRRKYPTLLISKTNISDLTDLHPEMQNTTRNTHIATIKTVTWQQSNENIIVVSSLEPSKKQRLHFLQ